MNTDQKIQGHTPTHVAMDPAALKNMIMQSMKEVLEPLQTHIDALENSTAAPAVAPVAPVATPKRAQTPKEKKEKRSACRDTLMRLIDTPLLAPKGATLLFKTKLYKGKETGNYSFNRPLYLKIANYVCDELDITHQRVQYVKIMHELCTKRRQYHQNSWLKKK